MEMMRKVKNLIRLSDLKIDDAYEIFRIEDKLRRLKYRKLLSDETIALFLPESSIRTRVTFERGINLLGGQSIILPPSSLDADHGYFVGYSFKACLLEIQQAVLLYCEGFDYI